MKYDQYQKCPTTPMMNPDHVANHPELIRAWDSETELKHKETFLLIIVLSSPTNKERRSITRETWANTHKTVRDNYLMYFILGHQELSAEIAQEIQDEKSQYKDILSLPLFDSYQTLTAKVLAAFVQLNRNVRFKYLLKVDDDSYVQLPVLIDELKNSNFEKELYWGFFDGRAPVQSKGKWVEKDYKLCDRYVPYALGGGYVLSQVRLDFFEIVSFHLRKHEIEFQFISFSVCCNLLTLPVFVKEMQSQFLPYMPEEMLNLQFFDYQNL